MTIPPKPPKLEELPAYTTLVAGRGKSTILADFDFETYSEAGFIWNVKKNKFTYPITGTENKRPTKRGLLLVGTAAYAEHPSTEILSMAYNLKDGKGPRLWRPGDPNPTDLFDHLARGELLEAWNVAFERHLWNNVCVKKYGWPPLPDAQLRCAMAKARAFGIPGKLAEAGKVMNVSVRKDSDGRRLINKFSIPRNPTKKKATRRIRPIDDLVDAENLYRYNLTDIATEAEIASLVPDLSDDELEFWKCDLAINARGVQIDHLGVICFIAIIEQAQKKYNSEVRDLTRGKVDSINEISKIHAWMSEYGVFSQSLDEEAIGKLLSIDLPSVVRRVLEIRNSIGSASVKKVYSMINQLTTKGRIHDLFIYHSARTGRAAGAAVQPQNMPNSGPAVGKCGDKKCGRYSKTIYAENYCPYCNDTNVTPGQEWNGEAVIDAFDAIYTGNLAEVEKLWGDSVAMLSGCLRGLFVAKEGHDLICSDYSAIEAVVLAALAGETWRMDVFHTHGKIYEMSASKITGTPFEQYVQFKKDTGRHHEDRKKGKVAELASGYQGWIGAWKNFGADKFMSEEEIKRAILAWRKASPKIVEFWGGQERNWRPEFYGIEGAAIQAVLNPGVEFSYRGIKYIVNRSVLYCQLLSGRLLTYHNPQVLPSERRPGTLSLSFEGWNTNVKYGATGWVRMDTYGGKLTENIVQATARDILAHAIVNLEKAGYPIVLHVHDEIVSEIPKNTGSIEEFEEIMSKLPKWAAGWPVKASGGWRGFRYGK